MKVAVLEKIGAPLAVRGIEVPWTLEDGQVFIQVLCTGICGSQLQEIDGKKGDPAHLPHLLGHEGCGIVKGVGRGVRNVKPGDKVVMHWRKGAGMDVAGGTYSRVKLEIESDGKIRKEIIKSGPITTFSEYSIVSENRVTKIDDDVPNDFAALLGCCLSTALAIIENEARPQDNEVVGIKGCGGLGLCLIGVLSHVMHVGAIGMDISEAKRELVEKMGGVFVANVHSSNFDILIDTVENRAPAGFPGRYISLQEGGTSGGGFFPAIDIPRYVKMWRDGQLDFYKDLITHRISLDQINEGIQLVRDGKAGRVMIDL